MTKLCSVCSAENRDEAQFCRSCGTAFAAAAAIPVAASSAVGFDDKAESVCAECGFRNKPGLRYCANCGVSLAAAGAAGLAAAAPAGTSPPPIAYESFATVGPYPPAPPTAPHDPPQSYRDFEAPDIPDPAATIAIRRQEAAETVPSFAAAGAAPPANRTPLIAGIVVAVLVVAGIAAWAFMTRSSSTPPGSPSAATPELAAPSPSTVPSTAPPTAAVIVEMPASAAATVASAPETAAVAAPSPAPAAIEAPPPAAAARLPQITDPIVVEPAEAEAKRLAADKQRREKAARDKVEREAKAKALAEQRDQAAATAAARAEQEAQARRRAEELQRARAAVVAPPPAPVQARGVRELCAGRGTIAEAVCQSRACGAAEHANEPICKQLREADERRRNPQL